jgi:hypothetical protein
MDDISLRRELLCQFDLVVVEQVGIWYHDERNIQA